MGVRTYSTTQFWLVCSFFNVVFKFTNCYRIFGANFSAYIASPAKGVVCHNVPFVADLAFHSLLRIGFKDCGGAVFQAHSTIKWASTFCLVYLDAHCALWNRELSQVLHPYQSSVTAGTLERGISFIAPCSQTVRHRPHPAHFFMSNIAFSKYGE